jgi:chromosomal replication initiation ATPase DnaA
MSTSPVLAELEEIVTLVIHDGGTLADGLSAAFRAAGAEHHLCVEDPAKPFLRAACSHFQCTIKSLLSPSRVNAVTARRYSVMVALRIAGMPLKAIAAALGYSDHSVVDYGLRKAQRRPDIQIDGETIFQMTQIKETA